MQGTMTMYKESSQNTKDQILNALENLLDQKALSDISVIEIANICNLSRQTFYRHFDDVYELILYLFEMKVLGFQSLKITNDFEFACTTSFKCMQKHPKLFRQIFINEKESIITDHILRWTIRRNMEFIPEKERTNAILYAMEHYWSGYIHMMKKWIASGMKETPENLGKYVYTTLPDCLKKYY